MQFIFRNILKIGINKKFVTYTTTFMSRFRIAQNYSTHLAITSTIKHQKIANNDLKLFLIQTWISQHVQCL